MGQFRRFAYKRGDKRQKEILRAMENIIVKHSKEFGGSTLRLGNSFNGDKAVIRIYVDSEKEREFIEKKLDKDDNYEKLLKKLQNLNKN